jgi:phenylacetate-CoA ligase
MAALPRHIAWAKKRAPGFARILASVNPSKIKSRQALATLPLTRKSDLATLQKDLPPLGGLNATPPAKLFVSPGPIHDMEGSDANWWRTARGLFAGGFRKGDVILNSYAYHFTPAGSMLETGAVALGCTVVPAGTGQTEMQVAAIERMRVSGYVGTPSFLKLIVEKAHELKADISLLKKAQVGAEYLPPVLRTALQECGISVTQMYGSADLGLIAYESLLPNGEVTPGMILEEGLLLEIVRPGSGDPVEPGEVGEVVITNFNRDYPLIRFATGDLSAVLAGVSPCGRTNVRIKGWMGRADQSTKVRAMFVTRGLVS